MLLRINDTLYAPRSLSFGGKSGVGALGAPRWLAFAVSDEEVALHHCQCGWIAGRRDVAHDAGPAALVIVARCIVCVAYSRLERGSTEAHDGDGIAHGVADEERPARRVEGEGLRAVANDRRSAQANRHSFDFALGRRIDDRHRVVVRACDEQPAAVGRHKQVCGVCAGRNLALHRESPGINDRDRRLVPQRHEHFLLGVAPDGHATSYG